MEEYSFVGCFVREIKGSRNPESYAKCQDFVRNQSLTQARTTSVSLKGKEGIVINLHE